MADDPDKAIRVSLVSIDEKKEFLTHYMSYRIELVRTGAPETIGGSKEDNLSKFWNDPNNNYLLWFMEDKERIGFAAMTLNDFDKGVLEEITVFREFRNQGYGMKVLAEIKKFASYRGLKELSLRTPEIMNGIKDYFIKSGFVESGDKLKIELSLFKPT